MRRSRILAVQLASAMFASLPVSAQEPKPPEGPGLVAIEARIPRVAAQAVQSYSRFVDPVNGLSPDELVRHALAHNGELAAARQMIAEARGGLKQAELRANPMVEAGGSRALNTPDNMTSAMFRLPLELGGRRGARMDVATREIELREMEVANFARRLAAEVRFKYADAVAAIRNLKYLEDLLNLTGDSHRLIEARVERGRSAPLELNQVFVEMNRIGAMRVNYQSRVELALLDLKRTVGMELETELRLRGEFDSAASHPERQTAIDLALAGRPDLAAARAAERLALARLEQARIEGRYDASLFAGYMRQRMGFGVRGINDAGQLAPVDGIFHFLTFGVQIDLPLRNRNEGNIESALAALEAVRHRRQFAELVVRNEVAAAYTRYERAQAALTLYRDRVHTEALRNLEIIHQTYLLGQKTLLDYIAEQRRFVDVEIDYTDVLKEVLDSETEIERAIGSASGAAGGKSTE